MDPDPTKTLSPEFCEECHKSDARVIDSRVTDHGRRKRYQCNDENCNYRWTTWECRQTDDDPTRRELEQIANKIGNLTQMLIDLTKSVAEMRKRTSRQ